MFPFSQCFPSLGWSRRKKGIVKIPYERSPVPTRAARKCSETIRLCASTYTRTVPGSTCALSAAKRSSSRRNSSGTSWCTRARSRSSAHSKAAANASRSTSTWGRTCGFTRATGPTSVPSTDVTRNLLSPPTSNRTSSLTLKPSNFIDLTSLFK